MEAVPVAKASSVRERNVGSEGGRKINGHVVSILDLDMYLLHLLTTFVRTKRLTLSAFGRV
jgi:hypothetical protein